MTSLLLLFSGFAALVYQVLWMRDLAVLFGNSTHAAAVDLAVFFGGLAAGAAVYARAAPRVGNPLRAYGLLELAVAASAFLVLGLLGLYERVYAPLYQRLADTPALLIVAKAALAAGTLALPTMFMGATLPAMVQHAPARPAWLYGMNTIGGTAGAFAGGFYLPPTLGFRGSYLLAVGVNVLAGALAIVLARRPPALAADPSAAARAPRERRSSRTPPLVPSRLGTLAFASGALTIGLEVAWLRMFAQVLDNSVYAFSAIIVVALVVFALAALAVDRLAPGQPTSGWVAAVLAVSAMATAAQPPLFVAFTDNLAHLRSDGWIEYVTAIFRMAAIFVGVPGFVAGLVFPSVLRTARTAPNAGVVVGRLVALNTAGAIGGSLLVTFAILPWLGLWGTLAAAAFTYAGLAAWMAWLPAARAWRATAALAAAASAAIGAFTPGLPRVRLDDARDERVLAVWEGGHGTIAVTEGTAGRALRLNNTYSLGGTIDRIERELIQALIPLLLHPAPRQVFFLGLGTGITAGEALRHPVERVVICELVPEVIRASRAYFFQWTGGLQDDPRVEIRAEDGRQYLAASGETFDVIISDLFVPWHAGTGMLYTREHFESVRARLGRGGLFAQWLPLFQLNQRDFEMIARTMLHVFPEVVLWQGDFYGNRPIVALVASTSPMRLDPEAIARRGAALASLEREGVLAAMLPYYAGNLSLGRAVLEEGPINTDGHPLIEYLSPLTQWSSDPRASPWFVSMPLVRFLARLRGAAPLDRDPYLSDLSARERGFVEAGGFYYRAVVQSLRGEDEAAKADLVEALRRLPEGVRVEGPFMAMERLTQ